jgi:DNA-binding Xre family transcriptional regulator
MFDSEFIYLKLSKNEYDELSYLVFKRNKKLYDILDVSKINVNNFKCGNIENARNVRTINIKKKIHCAIQDLLKQDVNVSMNKVYLLTGISKTTISKYWIEIYNKDLFI